MALWTRSVRPLVAGITAPNRRVRATDRATAVVAGRGVSNA